MTWNSWNIRPETGADVEQESTIQGQRQRIYRYSRESALVNNVLRASEARGLSGEDTMTALAYEALKRLEHIESLMLDQAYISPPPMIIAKPL